MPKVNPSDPLPTRSMAGRVSLIVLVFANLAIALAWAGITISYIVGFVSALVAAEDMPHYIAPGVIDFEPWKDPKFRIVATEQEQAELMKFLEGLDYALDRIATKCVSPDLDPASYATELTQSMLQGDLTEQQYRQQFQLLSELDVIPQAQNRVQSFLKNAVVSPTLLSTQDVLAMSDKWIPSSQRKFHRSVDRLRSRTSRHLQHRSQFRFLLEPERPIRTASVTQTRPRSQQPSNKVSRHNPEKEIKKEETRPVVSQSEQLRNTMTELRDEKRTEAAITRILALPTDNMLRETVLRAARIQIKRTGDVTEVPLWCGRLAVKARDKPMLAALHECVSQSNPSSTDPVQARRVSD